MGKRKDTQENMEEDDEQQQQNQSNLDDKSLYEILGVERTASQQDIKKAYHKLALRLHPDKNPGDEDAKEKFQQLQKVVSILGDEEKRALYDQTGCVDDADLAGDVVQNLKDFFRTMYKKVTEADIEEFEASYRGSELEKTDLIDLYNKYKGHMNRLFCSMLCSDPKLDSHRFKDILDDAISSGELKSTKAYQKWAKQVSDTKPPTNPLRGKEKSKKESDDLYAIISQRQSERKGRLDSMFSSLVSKYGGGQQSSEPTEEEFEAARINLEKRKASRKCTWYRTLLPTPVWYRFFLNKEYGSIFSSITTGLYLTFKSLHLLYRRFVWCLLLAALRALSRKKVHYGSSASSEQVSGAGDLCAICHEKMHSPIVLRCKHIFCEECVSEW